MEKTIPSLPQKSCLDCIYFSGVYDAGSYLEPEYYEWECQLNNEKFEKENTDMFRSLEDSEDYAPLCNYYDDSPAEISLDTDDSVYSQCAELYG